MDPKQSRRNVVLRNYANQHEVIATFVVGINPGVAALEDLATRVLNVYYGCYPTISHFVLVRSDGSIPDHDYERDREWNWAIYVIFKYFKPHELPHNFIDKTKLPKKDLIRTLDHNRARYIDTEVGNRLIPCYNIRQRQQERARRQPRQSSAHRPQGQRRGPPV
ncbi:hypothetical protein IWW57_005010 [Coemansia sp. S610]|nr:hypothetical protein IWW57_005010 [Coemansia sp. S610]